MASQIDMNAKAHEIIPGLWLGNKGASADTTWQQQVGIQTIFNCTKDLPFHNQQLSLYRVPVDDDLSPEEIHNLESWSWEVVYKVAKEHKEQSRPILVHCYAGMQRSAAVVAMYLVATFRCTTEEAIAYIKRKRPIAFHGNVNFYQAIKNFEKGYRSMIAEQNGWTKYPRIPLPQ